MTAAFGLTIVSRIFWITSELIATNPVRKINFRMEGPILVSIFVDSDSGCFTYEHAQDFPFVVVTGRQLQGSVYTGYKIHRN